MRHIPDGVLRRLDDEPFGVPDRVSEHVASCERCEARREEIARDTERAAELLAAPAHTFDPGLAWGLLKRQLEKAPQDRAGDRGRRAVAAPRRLPAISLRSALALGAVGIVLAGTAAAATLTTIFAPTHVAPVSLSQSDLQAIATFTGLGDSGPLEGFSTPNGSRALPFGALSWSARAVNPASFAAQAAAEAGIPVSLPAHVPGGVGTAKRFGFEPAARVTARFGPAAAGLAGSSVTLDVGPAVVTVYPGTRETAAPAMAIVTMRRPTARSTGASLSQIEAFLLRQPSIPPQLAEQVRLLGDLRTTLPVPVPPGIAVHAVRAAGWPAVLLTDPSNVASAVVWEDGQGLVHIVAGILDSRDVLNVADQLGR